MNSIPKISKGRAIGEILLVLAVYLFLSFFILMFALYGPGGLTLETLTYVTTPEGQQKILLPAILFNPVAMLLAVLTVWGLQKTRKEGFREIGLSTPRSWFWALKWGLVFAGVFYAVSVVALLGAEKLGFKQTSDDFLFIKENVWLFVFALTGIAWFSAGFGEEVLFRGFFLRNLTVLFGNSTAGLTLAVVGQAALFAVLHLNQGPGGAIVVFILALFFGFFFLKVGRNLWPLIIAHGLFDTVQFSLLHYFG